ncbi:MAG TPA: hypothetical protein H9813_02920 [Candidatus Fournierella merdipullorum]|uniref:Uncharacterized protein n=1 Tax=Candidatus Allofournierella merdipullorum TaxID=2838595 RepID=A0A9D2IYP5_9FIRM|nr:hypothetical protein [Candidatus Fournierella merdipullorum]
MLDVLSIQYLNPNDTVDICGAFESCAEKDFPEKGRSKLVSLSPDFRRCQAVFEGQSPKNGYSTNQTGIPRFGLVWQDFLENARFHAR